MKSLAAFMLVLLTYTPLTFAQELGRFVGMRSSDGSYNLTTNLGIEQWEEGRLTTHRRQQWWLNCAYPEPVTKRQETWCALDRVVIDRPLTSNGGSIIGAHKHSTSDGTLKIVRADWSTGILDFTVVLHDKSNIEVMTRLVRRGDGLILNSFKATAIARGMFSHSMATIDFKIPKYTYTLNVPVEMGGFKSESDREWDEMSMTLSKHDQELWKQLQPKLSTTCLASTKLPDEELLRTIIPNYESRKIEIEKGQGFTTEENAKISRHINSIVATDMEKCLLKSKISAVGQKTIIGFIKKQLDRSKE